MIGSILTGHGSFADGVAGAFQMIAGEQEHFTVIPFPEGTPMDEFEQGMADAVAKMLEQCEGVVIYTDLMGGTPFRTAMLAAADEPKAAVIAGTNLPLLLESGMARESYSNAKELAKHLEKSGRDTIVAAELQTRDSDQAEEEEGI